MEHMEYLFCRRGVMACYVILVGECVNRNISVLCFSWLYCFPTYIMTGLSVSFVSVLVRLFCRVLFVLLYLWLIYISMANFVFSSLLSQFDSDCCWDKRDICKILRCFGFVLDSSRY